MSAAAAITIEGLRCDAGARVTLDVARLVVAAGERLAIIGPNGAGKSTLLRCLTGFVPVAAGQVVVNGVSLHSAPGREELRRLRQQAAPVLQGAHLVQRLSVIDNVLIGALGRLRCGAAWRSWTRAFPDHETAAARDALRAVGFAGRDDERAERLSGGERQKVAIARALLQRAPLMLADEPTANLDPAAAREIATLLGRSARGATLLTVVHDTALLPLLADRVVGLRAGRIAFDVATGAADAARLSALYRVP